MLQFFEVPIKSVLALGHDMMPRGISSCFISPSSTNIFDISLKYPYKSATFLSETALGRGRIIAPVFGRIRQHRSTSRVQLPFQASGINSWDSIEEDISDSKEDQEVNQDENVSAKAAAAANQRSDLDALDSLLLELKGSSSPDPAVNHAPNSSPKSTNHYKVEDEIGMMGIYPNPSAPTDSETSKNLADDGFGELDDLLGLQDGVGDNFYSSSQAESVDEILKRNLPSAPKASVANSSGLEDSMSWLDDVLNVDSRQGQGARDSTTTNAATATAPAGAVASSQRNRGFTDGATTTRGSLEALLDEVSSSFPGSPSGSMPYKTAGPDEADAELPGSEGISSIIGRGTTVDDGLDRSGNGGVSRVDSSLLNGASLPPSSPAATLPIDPVATDPAGVPEAIDEWLDDFLAGTQSSPSMEASSSLPTPPPKQPVSQTGDVPRDGDSMSSNSWDVMDDDRGHEWRDIDERTGSGRTGRKESYGVVERFPRRTSADRRDMQRDFNVKRGRGEGSGGNRGDNRGFFKEDERWEAGSGRVEDGYGNEGWGWQDNWRDANPMGGAQKAVMADLKALGARGEWEDVIRALVGARVRGVPVNVYMYNRCEKPRL